MPAWLRYRSRLMRGLVGLALVLEASALFGHGSISPGLTRNTPAEDEALVDALLAKPAPAQDWRAYLKQRSTSVASRPPPDAPLETILEYWRSAAESERPDAATQERLLHISESQPAEIPALLKFLPLESAAVQDRLKTVHDQVASERTDKAAALAEHLRDVLMHNGAYFREELMRRAVWPDDIGEPAAEEAMESLLRLDRAGARALLDRAAAEPDAFRRAVSISGLLKYFSADVEHETRRAWREALKQIAVDSGAVVRVRRLALLSVTAERDRETVEWFMALFRNPAMAVTEEYSAHSTPLATVVAEDPDFWIPKVVALVGSRERAEHTNAVYALLQFNNERARPDALRPLLPWLRDSTWAPEAEHQRGRLRVIQSLDRLQLPEAVPPLMKVAATATGYELQGAAQALAHHRAREAVSVLKASLRREKEAYHLWAITRALLVLDDFAPKEAADALVRYAMQMSTATGRQQLEAAASTSTPKVKLDSGVFVGQELARSEVTSDEVAIAVLKAADRLVRKSPVAADLLSQFTVQWQTPAAQESVRERLRAGSITADWVERLVEARAKLTPIVEGIPDLEGTALGVQAAVTSNAALVDAVLDGEDAMAKQVLLATARLARVSLPLDRIAALLVAPDKRLAKAADLYLEANDTSAAREAIWSHELNNARILGRTPGFSAERWRGPIAEAEESLRQLVLRDDGPEEIFALLSEGTWGGRGQRALLAYKDRAVVRCDDGNGRSREQTLPAAQFTALRDWLHREQVDDLPGFDVGTSDGVHYHYLHLRRDGGRRVYMNNPPGANAAPRVEFGGDDSWRVDAAIYGELAERLSRLEDLRLEVTYPTLKHLPEMGVLHAAEDGEITVIARREDQLLAGIRVPADQQTEWHIVSRSDIADEPIATPPELVATGRKERFPEFLDDEPLVVREGPFAGKHLWPETRRKDNLIGLWASAVDAEPELVVRGRFARPVICPGGRWAVAAKTFGENMWDKPNEVVRIDLQTLRTHPVALAPAETLDPLAWIDAHQRVLLQRDEDAEGDAQKPEFFLLDAVSGELRPMTGEFQPLLRLEDHQLQPTGRPDEFWAVIHENMDAVRPTTVLGRYNTRDFAFTGCMRFPEVFFYSWQAHVDEKEQTVRVAMNGDLLRFSTGACGMAMTASGSADGASLSPLGSRLDPVSRYDCVSRGCLFDGQLDGAAHCR